ncbi:tetratricopeptide repeat protein (plasmid) [Acaryochloris sp. 'Moss Beach']|uniref:serine/threonine-protein kinase n=1 Tax=Acaryochloris sp. 'Moss Beach' TaxID=2740837 RepID=UPI001F21F565|nr:serine/threonine-protein kinase [Acaryochloris sp. 'Moss Beach']UJB73080.1 tetratricopeptide repeat protein [Acaryochloris sp. 'Moss Beach']
MSYCINPNCTQRENPPGIDLCQGCGTALLIKDKYRLLRPIRSLDTSKQLYPSETEIFECIDTKGNPKDPPNTPKIFKILNSADPKLKQLAKREAYALMKLYEYPNTPKVHVKDYFEYQDEHFPDTLICTAIEKIEGVDLKVWLAENGHATSDQLKGWLGQLCEILAVIHERNYFHRDIKPSNIMLRPDGRLVLIDFGTVRDVSKTYIAKLIGPDNKTPIQGATDVTMVRTFGYSPPEQLYGKALPQSDFFALGRTLIHLATGIHPNDLPEVEDRVVWRDQANNIDPDLADLIDRLCDPISTNRPRNTEAILADLAQPPRKTPVSKRPYFLQSKWIYVALGMGIATAINWGLMHYLKPGEMLTSKNYLTQGLSELRVRDLPAAQASLSEAIRLNPKNEEAHYYLAFTCAEVRNHDCAVNHYQKAIDLNPKDWESQFALASLYEKLEKEDKAKPLLKSAHSIDPKAPEPLNNLARLALLEGHAREGQQLAQKALKLTKRPIMKSIIYKNLGWAAFLQKDQKLAYQYLNKSIEFNPELPDPYCLLNQIEPSLKYREACISLISERSEVREWRKVLLKQET